MHFRRYLLLGMLLALGLCAAAGVLTVFIGAGDYMGRVLATAIDTAVATGLLLPLSFLVRREKLRIGGFTGIGVILLAWFLSLGTIWSDGVWSYRVSEKLGLSAILVLFMGVPSAALLLLISFRQARVAVYTFVAGAAIAWLLCELDVLDWGWTGGDKFMTSGMTLYGVMTCAAALLVNFGCGDRRYFRWAGMISAAVGMLMALFSIWFAWGDEYFSRLADAIIVPSVVMGHINLVLMAKLRARQEWLKWAVCGLSILCGVLSILAIMRWELGPEALSRGSASAGIVAACGSLAIIVLSMLNRKADLAVQTPGALEATSLELTCPRCAMRQQVQFGDSTCRGCELQFFIRITEPRCPACGYLLYQLTSPQCPECGARVREEGSIAPVRPGAPVL